jgi:protein O-GlcNAc transferase
MQDYETGLPSAGVHLNIKTGSDEVAKLVEGALALDAQNQKDSAMRMIDNALRIEPRNPSLYYLMARYFFDTNNTEMARHAIEKAVYLVKDEPNYFKLQGDIYRGSGLPDKAISSYKRSLVLDGTNVPALNNLGNTCREQERLNDAQKYLNRALANDADFIPARYNLALLLIDNKDMAAAEAELRICIEKAPTVPNAWFSLVQILDSDDRQAEAITLLEGAINYCPDIPDLCLKLIGLYENFGQDSKAAPLYKKVDQLDPSIAQTYLLNAGMLMNRLMQTDAQSFANRAAQLNEENIRNQLFMSSYLAVEDVETCFQRHLDWNAGLKVKEARSNHLTHSVKPGKDRVLRIGYVSPDFYMHAVSYFTRNLLRNHDRSEFEVFCYANMHTPADPITKELKALTDHWREIQGLSDYEAARLINRDNIDILIDLSGHTRGSRTSLFAFKPAPIQTLYLGYPGSSGLTEMDYWITDHLIHPIDTTEPSSETKYRLNRNWIAYGMEEKLPALTEKPAAAPITFGVINHIGKHSRQFINVWGQILKRNPNARLLVKSVEFRDAELRIKVINYLEELGVDRQRLTLVGQSLTHSDHLDTYNTIDVCLDPFPYNGGTSTADALAMGVPVVSLAGDTLKGRMGLAILTTSGFSKWIVDSHEAYAQIATDLAKTGTSLNEKQRIRDTFLGSEVTDGPGLVKELERAYRNMWRGYCDTQPTLQ